MFGQSQGGIVCRWLKWLIVIFQNPIAKSRHTCIDTRDPRKSTTLSKTCHSHQNIITCKRSTAISLASVFALKKIRLKNSCISFVQIVFKYGKVEIEKWFFYMRTKFREHITFFFSRVHFFKSKRTGKLLFTTLDQ